jgi:hypothetical protein
VVDELVDLLEHLRVHGSGSPHATVELRHASGALEALERGYFTHAAGLPTDAASTAAIEAELALVAAALAPYGTYQPEVNRAGACVGGPSCLAGAGLGR